jgi:predicted outer membrane protein
MKSMIKSTLPFILLLGLAPAFAQTKPAATPAPDTMQILREKLKADKKLVVAANMELNDKEAPAFWPIYDEYQKELAKINKRTGDLIKRYAREYNADSLKNDEARKLIKDVLEIEAAELAAKRTMVDKLSKVLTGKKMARYVQIEQKIRAAVMYELADAVPLAK